MDENRFFHEATLRICGSLNLQRSMERTLTYVRGVVPADCLHIGLYDAGKNVMRTLAYIRPDHWFRIPDTMAIPEAAMAAVLRGWRSKPKFGVINNIEEIEPGVQELIRTIWPEDTSLLHTDLELESRRIGVFLLGTEGRNRYQENHARLMSLLNEPLSIAVANALQYQETVRLKEMLEEDNQYLHKELRHVSGDTIIGIDFGLRGVMEMIRQVSPLDSPVLLLGETGTGKELLANVVHASSLRRDGPFIKVNCGGMSESLLDSELFGHEKGAFTGASSKKRGRFERAHGGTIFLDEIGELSLAAQVKLLRVLQHKEIERVGGTETVAVDVRIISATHQNLEEMIRHGKFREDLWFRLNVFPIMIPPLRQRLQDLPVLVDYLIDKKCREMKISKTVRLSPGTLEALKQHSWPGNVRELENLVERSLIYNQVGYSDVLSLDLKPKGSLLPPIECPETGAEDEILPFDDAMALHILKALKRTSGKVIGPEGAAQLLRLHPSTLRGKMHKLNINKLPLRKNGKQTQPDTIIYKK